MHDVHRDRHAHHARRDRRGRRGHRGHRGHRDHLSARIRGGRHLQFKVLQCLQLLLGQCQ